MYPLGCVLCLENVCVSSLDVAVEKKIVSVSIDSGEACIVSPFGNVKSLSGSQS